MLEISSLEGWRENNRIEAKKALGGLPESIWETYSAFANTDGGIILLGVREDKDRTLHAVNLPAPKALVRDFREDVSDNRKVSANILSPENVVIEELDGKKIIVIEVPPAEEKDKPIYVGGDPFSGSYYRSGDGDFKYTEEQVHAMLERAAYLKEKKEL